jgi:hypothetical protein
MTVVDRLPYAVMEAAVIVLFLGYARFAWRTGGRRRLLELVSAVPYGLLLEQGDIMIFGSYAYNQQFLLKLGAVPLVIALAWAMIINSCMYISDTFGVSPRLAPFTDAILAIVLDLSFDAIAIRQGLWHWVLPLNRGFFGVPAGNYYAWLFVAFGFSAWTRLNRRTDRQQRGTWRQLLVPLPAYATLLVALLPFIVLEKAFFNRPGGGFPTFIGTLAVFAVVGGRPLLRRPPALAPVWAMPLLPRLAMHAYFIGAGVLLGVFWQFPVLLAASVSMLIVDLWVTGRRPDPAVLDKSAVA